MTGGEAREALRANMRTAMATAGWPKVDMDVLITAIMPYVNEFARESAAPALVVLDPDSDDDARRLAQAIIDSGPELDWVTLDTFRRILRTLAHHG